MAPSGFPGLIGHGEGLSSPQTELQLWEPLSTLPWAAENLTKPQVMLCPIKKTQRVEVGSILVWN